ncbi:hypothetical protein NLI96_g3289 [Meripilus lineatus]|uniref:Uncharacterized protein n=1 Tax=Meripilus lineatus TaxID=2056292 RepID=A0AAD5V945_9APHY|nr:hypothetical protein NLI96_g3289 [Physisporinus lineatus]
MKRWLLTLTLKSCNRVCKIWHLICRKCLMKDIRIGSRGQLDEIVKGFAGNKDFKLLELTTRLTLEMAPKKLGTCSERSFGEATIRYLSSRLPHLQELQMQGHAAKEDLAPFPISRSLTVHFKQFLQLRDLSLAKYRFRTFWDLHRLAASIPSLSSLRLDQVTWPPLPPTTNRLPSPHSVPSLFSHLRIGVDSHAVVVEDLGDQPTDWTLSALWFWATNVPTPPSPFLHTGGYPRNLNLPNDSVPRFTPRDVLVIQQALRMFFGTFPPIGYLEFSWLFDPGRDICHFSCRDGSDSGPTTMSFEIGKRLLPTHKGLQPHHLTPIASVHALGFTERNLPIESMRPLEWYRRLAAIASDFQDLRGIYACMRTYPLINAPPPSAQEQWLQQRKRVAQTVRRTIRSLKHDLYPLEVSFVLVFDDNVPDEETSMTDIDTMPEELEEDTPTGSEESTNDDMQIQPPEQFEHRSDALSYEATRYLPESTHRSQFEDAVWSYLNSAETALERSHLLPIIQPNLNLNGSSVVQTEMSQAGGPPDFSWSEFDDVLDLGRMT